MSNVSPIESEKLKKLAPAPTIPIDQLRAQIASFRHINTDKDKSWIYIVGGGSGSGLILLLKYVVVCTGDVRILRTQVPDHHPMSPILLQRTKT